MALLSNIRRSTKKNKLFYLILAIVLSVGLVGSFAIWSSPDVSQNNISKENQQAPEDGQIAEPQTLLAEVEKCEKLLQNDPGNQETLLQLGRTRYYLGNYYLNSNEMEKAIPHFRQAVSVFQQAMEKDPQNVDLRIDLGTAAFLSGQEQIAEQNFQKAIELDPSSADAHYKYGIFLMQKKDFAGAIKQWNTVLELKPGELAEQQVQSLIQKARQELNDASGKADAKNKN